MVSWVCELPTGSSEELLLELESESFEVSTVTDGDGDGDVEVGTSWTPTTGVAMLGGGWMSVAGVPAGTSSVTVTVWPVARVITNVRWSAEAGKMAAPNPADSSPATSNPISSLRLFIAFALSSKALALPEWVPLRCGNLTRALDPAVRKLLGL